ncbi:MAG: ImmA/IrrE family metallo-endopeptidase [Spirochaetaceae bacterium]|nr:ImmA/IrrE family metallo-endopeptidase [Spirochaetaceae bacterium]
MGKTIGTTSDTFGQFRERDWMTFSAFAQLLKSFANENCTNGQFVLDLIDESLEDIKEEDKKQVLQNNVCYTYNPIKSEESARKYYDGSRKITRQNFEIIGKHYERSKFINFLRTKLLQTDDNYRHIVLKLKSYGIETTIDDVENMCADLFDIIITNCDKEYKKPSEQTLVIDEEQEKFKNFTFEIFQKIIKNKNWSFYSSKYKIFKNELYELTYEDADERFDIAIENYNGVNPLPAIKLLIKCKKTKEAVSVDELRLFDHKVKQIQGCTKAFFVTNSFFQDEAILFAEKAGIGILRIFDEDKIKWLAPRKMDECTNYIGIEKCEAEIKKALQQDDYKILNNFAVGYYGQYNGNISSIVNKIFTDSDYTIIDNSELYAEENDFIKAEELKFISIESIKEIASNILFDMYGEKSIKIKKVDLESLKKYLNTKFGFSIEFPSEYPEYTFPQNIYGLIDYKNKKILIYGQNKTDIHLLKFSIAHEISHLVLHKNLLENGDNNFSYFYSATKESKQMETQANILASYIILNDKSFQLEFLRLAKTYYLTKKNGHYLYLDNQKCNINDFLNISKELKNIFDVSRKQIKYRLMELGWLKEA